MKSFAAILCVTLAACSGSSAPPPGAKPPVVTFIARGLPLAQGSSTPAVIGIDAATGAVQIIIEHDPAAHIDVYMLADPSEQLPVEPCPARVAPNGPAQCIADIGSGVRETLERTVAGAVAIVLRSGTGRVNVRLEYDEKGRDVSVTFPRLEQPAGASVCKDNGCNPFFEMMPVRAGSFTARAHWGGGEGLLQIQSGRVIGQSFSATGIPYRIPAEDRGSSPLSVKAHFDAPAEYALAFVNADVHGPLLQIRLDARWP